MTAQPARRRAPSPQPTPSLAALVLSAGAPNELLIAGFLCGVLEQGKTFDIIFTSGGSAFLGLVYTAPRNKEPEQALRGLIDLLGISDVIFRLFPMNYKVFVKAGPFTKPILRFADLFKIPPPDSAARSPMASFVSRMAALSGGSGDGKYRRLYNDLVDMWAAIITPTTVTPRSTGICDAFPFLEDVVDFSKLKRRQGLQFYMNAFNVTDGCMDVFFRDQIDARHFRAALAFPFMYPPVEIDGKVYVEGADVDPVNFDNFVKIPAAPEVRTMVLIDVLGSLGHDIVRVPKGLWDAYGMSILVPAVSLADKCIKYFEHVTNKNEDGKSIYQITKIKFDIPAAQRPHIMDWSYSNLQGLFDVGHAAGVKFAHAKAADGTDVLPDRRS